MVTMPKIRHTGDDEPVWLFDRDHVLRNGVRSALVVAVLLLVVSVGLGVTGHPWALTGVPPALLMGYANLRLRDVNTSGAALGWLLVTGLAMVAGFALVMLATR